MYLNCVIPELSNSLYKINWYTFNKYYTGSNGWKNPSFKVSNGSTIAISTYVEESNYYNNNTLIVNLENQKTDKNYNVTLNTLKYLLFLTGFTKPIICKNDTFINVDWEDLDNNSNYITDYLPVISTETSYHAYSHDIWNIEKTYNSQNRKLLLYNKISGLITKDWSEIKTGSNFKNDATLSAAYLYNKTIVYKPLSTLNKLSAGYYPIVSSLDGSKLFLTSWNELSAKQWIDNYVSGTTKRYYSPVLYIPDETNYFTFSTKDNNKFKTEYENLFEFKTYNYDIQLMDDFSEFTPYNLKIAFNNCFAPNFFNTIIACNYDITTDINRFTPEGYESISLSSYIKLSDFNEILEYRTYYPILKNTESYWDITWEKFWYALQDMSYLSDVSSMINVVNYSGFEGHCKDWLVGTKPNGKINIINSINSIDLNTNQYKAKSFTVTNKNTHKNETIIAMSVSGIMENNWQIYNK